MDASWIKFWANGKLSELEFCYQASNGVFLCIFAFHVLVGVSYRHRIGLL